MKPRSSVKNVLDKSRGSATQPGSMNRSGRWILKKSGVEGISGACGCAWMLQTSMLSMLGATVDVVDWLETAFSSFEWRCLRFYSERGLERCVRVLRMLVKGRASAVHFLLFIRG